jgi:hypothetical protein
MVPELSALGFFTMGHMHVTVFREFCVYIVSYRNLNFSCGFSKLSYTLSTRFIIVTTVVPELRALGIFTIGHLHVTVFHHQKRGP